ncbi:hypothetical protein Hdeb2414_s0004g00131371 [Helianthus debilis subsp. tardiflorus]
MYSSSSLLIQMIQASIIRSSPEFQPSLSLGFLISLSVKLLNQFVIKDGIYIQNNDSRICLEDIRTSR